VLGFDGDERTTRRAVHEAKARPWISLALSRKTRRHHRKRRRTRGDQIRMPRDPDALLGVTFGRVPPRRGCPTRAPPPPAPGPRGKPSMRSGPRPSWPSSVAGRPGPRSGRGPGPLRRSPSAPRLWSPAGTTATCTSCGRSPGGTSALSIPAGRRSTGRARVAASCRRRSHPRALPRRHRPR
jgi:hypothetical protein